MPVIIEMSVSEQLDESDDGEVPDARLIECWANAASESEQDAIVSIQIVSAAEMQTLNRTWRGKDKPTNVLSFPAEAGDLHLPAEAGMNLLGDLALCAAVIKTEALQQHKPLHAHWAHMVVHGMLHLQGYDHIETNEAERMEARETAILQQFGFPDPYQDTYQKP
jgi:probable rRNA maturation factor